MSRQMVVTNAQLCVYVKNHWIAHIKGVNVVVCKLYYKKAVIKETSPYFTSSES